MGASGWSYWTPYQADINKALQDLQQRVFESGDFYNGYPNITDEEIIELYTDVGLDAESIHAQLDAAKGNPVERLLIANGFDGTHSILDVRRIAEQPASDDFEDVSFDDIGFVFPISSQDMQSYFNTEHPTRAQVELVIDDIRDSCPRWTGKYVIAFENTTPAEILFVGITGD